MMTAHTVTALFFLLLTASYIEAQELNCRVTVDRSQVQGTGVAVFATLEDAISDYLNTRKRTDASISTNERIDCTFFFTITGYEPPEMSGTLQIQSSRPVYNSVYTTTLINFKDNKINFEYNEGDPLVFSENTFEGNLTSILDFYAYLIIAIDFDSFSPRGGEPYYKKAQDIVYRAQSSGESGWRAFEDTRNRSALLSAYTDTHSSALRDLLYEYHRNGLDLMALSPDKGRHAITSSLIHLQKVHEAHPVSVGLEIFRDPKLDELVNLYTRAGQEERNKAVGVLEKVYPSETQRMAMIKQGVNK